MNRFGFTRTELVVVIASACLLAVVASLFVKVPRQQSSHLTCALNLRMLGTDSRAFANDHDGRYAWGLSTNDGGSLEFALSGGQVFRHFQCQSNYIVAQVVLVCPQDTRQANTNWSNLANTNVSYFVGLDSDPKLPLSIMAGDRNTTVASGVILQWNASAPPQWVMSVGLHGDKGHIVFGDGHVEELDSAGLSNAVQRASMSTSRFAIP